MPHAPTALAASGARSAFGPRLLLGAYGGLILSPVVVAWSLGFPPRSFLDELSSALAMMAFAGLLLEFVLSGRFETISGGIGIDVTMRFHQLMARPLAVFVLVHPLLYTTSVQSYPPPGDVTRQWTLGLALDNVVTGTVAWLALMLLVVLALLRTRSDWSYEAWRLSHGLAALVFAAFATHHTLDAGRYSSAPVLAAFWGALLAIAVLSLTWVYVITPLRQLRSPYRVTSVRQVALKTFEVAIEPTRGEALAFEAGQFVWLTLDRSPFAITEHPFSIASSPSMRPRLAFLIKQAGDGTDAVARLRSGTRAYVDGPHGALTITGRSGTRLVLIAGGVGLAPIISILRQAAATEEPRPVLLVYGNRCEEQIAYRDELLDLRRRLALQIELVLSEPPTGWTGRVGLLDRAMLEACLPTHGRADALYVVCGPAPVIEGVERDLVALGVPLSQIVSETFSYD
jgi:predicted ferric reductase